MAKDYVDLKIDQDRMTKGKAVAKKLRGERGGGIPWIVILDAEGKELISSDGPKGNVGCPAQPHEIEHFIYMLAKTHQNMSEEDLAAVEKALKAYAEKILAPRQRR